MIQISSPKRQGPLVGFSKLQNITTRKSLIRFANLQEQAIYHLLPFRVCLRFLFFLVSFADLMLSKAVRRESYVIVPKILLTVF